MTRSPLGVVKMADPRPAMESRFSTVVGRLQATGTAGDANETSESRGNGVPPLAIHQRLPLL